MNKVNRFVSIEIILALLIIIAYFLPWIDLGIIKMVGWEIPNLQKKLTSVGNFFSRNKSSVYTTYAIFLLPLFSAIVVALWILMKQRAARILLVITAVFGTILSTYLFFNLPKRGSTGVYLLFAASVISIVYIVVVSRRRKEIVTIADEQASNEQAAD